MKNIVLFLLAMMALAPLAQAQDPRPILQQPDRANKEVYYDRRATLFELLPVGKKDIVFFGNSLTDGCEWCELFNNKHVKNRGIIGDIIQGLIDRAEPILKGQPKKIFILSGVNDVSHGVSGDSIGRVAEKLIMLIKQRSPRTKIYLQSMLPFNNEVREWKYLVGRDHVVVEGNKALEEVAKRQGVTWINLYPLFDDGTGHLKKELTNDGLHLLGPGYLIWRDAIKQYVK
ncbi:MAG: sialate O-acetylesterase [Muribaculaceae bacterium]|nr:sialate O-acetylesterase [Muribaculaceae bacterium]